MRKIYLALMAPKNPARYGAKNNRPLATTIDEENFEKAKKLAEAGRISLSAWLRQTVVEAIRADSTFGIARIKKDQSNTPVSPYILNNRTPGIGAICETPEPGSSPVRKPIPYPKGIKQK